MPLGKGRRKSLLVFGFILLLLATLWVCFPLWFPWVLRPVALRLGASYGSYERLGYGRFRLNALTLTNESLTLGASRVESVVPTAWLWKLATQNVSNSGPFVQVNDWTLTLLPRNKPPSPPNSQLQDTTAALKLIQRWIPEARMSNGVVHSDDLNIAITEAAWKQGRLAAQVDLPHQLSGQKLSLTLLTGQPIGLQLLCPSLDIDSRFEISTNQSGFDVRNTSLWQSNRFELQAHFGATDMLPQTAILNATNLLVPASVLKLPHYDAVIGSVAAQWREGQFELQVSAAAHPSSTETNWPAAELQVQVRGNTNAATVEQLSISSSPLKVSLSNQVSIGFSAPYLRSPGKLNLAADLAQQHWFPLSGQLTGTAQFEPGPRRFPTGTVHVVGTQIGDASLKTSSLDVSANLDWPNVNPLKALVQFDDGSQVNLETEFDIEKNQISNGNVRFQGPLLRRWLPAEYSFQDLSLSGKFHGSPNALTHSGQLEVTGITLPGIQPLGLSVQWNGQAKTLQDFSLQLADPRSQLTASGSLAVETNKIALRLEILTLRTNGAPALELKQPLTIDYESKSAEDQWRLNTSPLLLTGAAGEVTAQATAQWPNQGTLQLSVKRFSVRFLAAIARLNLPQVNIDRLEASAGWSNSPVSLQLSAAASGLVAPPASNPVSYGQTFETAKQPAQQTSPDLPAQILTTPLRLELHLAGDAHGLVLSNLVVNSPTSAVAVAHGFMPVTITPTDKTNILNMAVDEPLEFKASIRPEAFFWQTVSQLAGVQLEDPKVDVELGGTWRTPQGKLVASARNIQLTQTTLTNLTLSDLRLALNINRERASLTEGQVLVQGQRVTVTGELPLDETVWAQLKHKKIPSWERATAQLKVQDARIAAFTPLFPEVLAPEGELNVDLRLKERADLEGTMALRHARTRPLGHTAPLRDITVTLHFKDRVLDLENASANLSGATVELTGRADLRDTHWIEAGLPPFTATLSGTNVPLAREPEYIIRSDLNLAVLKTNGAPPLVTGSARLRDSFFLSDLRMLIPGKVTTPAGRPPFFSIDNPTLADWRLAVSVEGVKWLQVRTSLFNGAVSANLNLEGTLKDPIALGGLNIDSGLMRFPFANIQIQEGLVTLTSQDPYRPQLLVRGASRQFGYDIRMEVTGTVDSPIIQFTSNPSLSSAQILLMITAGQLPTGTMTLSPQQRAQTVAVFLGRDLLSKLGLGDKTEERLTISSGEEISVQNRPTYRIEYKLTPRWSLTGEYDRFGDFNAGLKWRVYSK